MIELAMEPENITPNKPRNSRQENAIWTTRKNKWILLFFILSISAIIIAASVAIDFQIFQISKYFYNMLKYASNNTVVKITYAIISIFFGLISAFGFVMIATIPFYTKELYNWSKHFLTGTILLKHIVPFGMYRVYRKNIDEIHSIYNRTSAYKNCIKYCPALSMLYIYQKIWGQDTLRQIYEKDIPPWRLYLKNILLSSLPKIEQLVVTSGNGSNADDFILAIEYYFTKTIRSFKDLVCHFNATYYSLQKYNFDIAKTRLPAASTYALKKLSDQDHLSNINSEYYCLITEGQYIFNYHICTYDIEQKKFMVFSSNHQWFDDEFREKLRKYTYYGLYKQGLLPGHRYRIRIESEIDYFEIKIMQYELTEKARANTLLLMSFGNNIIDYHKTLANKIYRYLKNHCRELPIVT